MADLLIGTKMQNEGIKAAVDTAKQIITLSTGVIALTMTFLDKFLPGASPKVVPWTVTVAWIGFGLAIVFSVWTLMALTGTLTALDRKANGLSLTPAQSSAVDAYGDNVKVPATGMVLCFLFGIALTIATGIFI
jgi:hypothetical protein